MKALTKRQRQVAILLSNGISVKEAANRLGCSSANIYLIRSAPHVRDYIEARVRRNNAYVDQLQMDANKTCATCETLKPYSDFYHNSKTGVTDSYCRKCRNQYNAQHGAARKAQMQEVSEAQVSSNAETVGGDWRELFHAKSSPSVTLPNCASACDCISVDPIVLREILTGQREPDDALLAQVGLRRVTRIEPIAEEQV